MKVSKLSIIVTSVIVLLLLNTGSQAFARSPPIADEYIDETGETSKSPISGVEFLDIQTVPSVVRVGEVFGIEATIINNSPYAITYHGLCESPMSAVFDNIVEVEHVPACMGFSIHELKTGEKVSVVGPGSGIVYHASSAGVTNVTVRFTYETQNESRSASKAFTLTIEGSADLITAKLGMEFQLKINQTAIIEPTNLKVRFMKVTEDSRCPTGVQCVWEGQARILVTIMKNNKKIIDLDLTTNPGFGDLAFRAFDKYSIRLVKIEPYPSSGEMIPTSDYVVTMIVEQIREDQSPDRVLVRGTGNFGKILAVWNYEAMKGVMITFSPDAGRSVLHLKLTFADCVHFRDSDDCITAGVYTDRGSIPMGIRLEVDNKNMKLFLKTLDKSAEEMLFDVENMKKWSMNIVSEERSKVILREGEREGPLLVHEIYPDRVEGLNFLEYPLSMDKGLSLTLHIGDSASNGCTIMLTLLEIHGTTAKFLKTVDTAKPCPICWHDKG